MRRSGPARSHSSCRRARSSVGKCCQTFSPGRRRGQNPSALPLLASVWIRRVVWSRRASGSFSQSHGILASGNTHRRCGIIHRAPRSFCDVLGIRQWARGIGQLFHEALSEFGIGRMVESFCACIVTCAVAKSCLGRSTRRDQVHTDIERCKFQCQRLGECVDRRRRASLASCHLTVEATRCAMIGRAWSGDLRFQQALVCVLTPFILKGIWHGTGRCQERL